MALFKAATAPQTGEKLQSALSQIQAAYVEDVSAVGDEAADRATVVQARLASLEAEQRTLEGVATTVYDALAS